MQDVQTTEIDVDLARLETSLRQLKIQYDMFFAGSIPRQPVDLRSDVERLIKRYSNAPIRKYATRFHFNSLVSRYNSLSELWTKTLRNLEEGERPVPAVMDRASEERTLASCVVQDPSAEKSSLRALHARFLEARRKAGEADPKLSFASFLRGIAAQAGKLRENAGCDKIELRLVVRDRKVQLKARPGR